MTRGLDRFLEMKTKDELQQDAIDEAYCFFHQKWQVYRYSHSETQREDIEYAIASYVEQMNPRLYAQMAEGRPEFLLSPSSFDADMSRALLWLEARMK